MAVDLAVIPVAGQGTRLLPLTKSLPKEMLPAGRKPALQHIVEELARCGLRHLCFITAPDKTAIENHFRGDDFAKLGLQFDYLFQGKPLGLGHAVLCARPKVQNHAFAVALGDCIIGLNGQSDLVTRMIAAFETSRADAVIAFDDVPLQEVPQYGIARPRNKGDAIFELADIVEKPAVAEAPSTLAVAARYVFSPDIFPLLATTPPGKGGEIQLTDAVRALIKKGGKVLGVRLGPGDRRYDVGNFESYYRLFCEFALADPQYGPGLRAHLKQILKMELRVNVANEKGSGFRAQGSGSHDGAASPQTLNPEP